MLDASDLPLVQIAGVIDEPEARILIEAGVRWLGFPLRLTVNKEDLSEDAAAALIRRLPAECRSVLITYLGRADTIAAFCAKLGVRTVQLHGAISVDQLRQLRQIAPELTVFKSLVVRAGNEPALRQMVLETAPYVDAYITDTFNPATGQEGATGLTHDWSISRRLVELSPRPVILAGGLTPDNVAEAIRVVGPAGVDTHTGVEGPDGRKSAAKVRAFVEAARQAYSKRPPTR